MPCFRSTCAISAQKKARTCGWLLFSHKVSREELTSLRNCMCHTLICFTCLCACLHPHPAAAYLPHYPQCIYTRVLCCQFVLSGLTSVVSRRPAVSSSVSLVLIILTALSLPAVLYLPDSDPFKNLCLSWRRACLLFCTLLTLPWIMDLCLPLTCILPPPAWANKHLWLAVCSWALSWVLIWWDSGLRSQNRVKRHFNVIDLAGGILWTRHRLECGFKQSAFRIRPTRCITWK